MLGELSAADSLSRAYCFRIDPFLCSGNDDVAVRITHCSTIGVL